MMITKDFQGIDSRWIMEIRKNEDKRSLRKRRVER